MINYDKNDIKSKLSQDDYFDLFSELGANPQYSNGAIVCDTICHNAPGEGSRKLYLYGNEGKALCHCYTNGCEESTFDIFQLIQKVAKIQWNEDYDLNDSVRFVAKRFGIPGQDDSQTEINNSEDWKIFKKYDKIKEIEEKDNKDDFQLKEYSNAILDKLNYSILIRQWYDDGISPDIMRKANIGFFPGDSQITIPHYDKENRFIGLRGRTLIKEDAERYGKYRPMKINGIQYNHPLGFNLYGLNWSKENIKRIKKVIIFESEKSVLKFATEFGWENNISVACCGSNISAYQIQLLLNLGAEEIIIALDRDFETFGDKICKNQIKKYEKLHKKYSSICNISFIFDKSNLLDLKMAPIEKGKDVFMRMFKERVKL